MTTTTTATTATTALATALVTALLAVAPTASAAPLTAAAPAPAMAPGATPAHAGNGTASAPHTWTVTVGSEARGGLFQGMNYGSNEIWIDAGDTVHWVAASMEPHTVTFGIDAHHPFGEFGAPGNEYMAVPTPKATISRPGEFRNSGLLTTMPSDLFPPAVPQRAGYDLTFTGVGTYDYYCYLHGKVQHGIVHVAAAGTPYRHSQAWYDAATRDQVREMAHHGRALTRQMRAASSTTHVLVGAADDKVMVMANVRKVVEIRVGQSVTFEAARNGTMPVPHTVTFGSEPAPNPLAKVGDPNHYAGGPLSSGVLLPAAFGGPSTYTVTFTKPGRYHYVCVLHDHMGMVGDVVVEPGR